MQSALLTNFKVLLALLFRDIVHQISKLIFYVTHISASFPTFLSRIELISFLSSFYNYLAGDRRSYFLIINKRYQKT